MRHFSFLAVGLVLFVSCSGDDGGGSSTDTAATESSTPAGASDAQLEMTSPAFVDGEAIPPEHAACVDGAEGPDTSPPLAWEGVPDGAEQLAVTLVDPDAGGFVHWVIAGIDPSSGGLATEEVPAEAVEALNDTGEAGYFGPCPPEAHTYVFTVHVLEADPGIDASTPGVDAVAAVEAASTVSAELTGTYDPGS